MQLSSRFVLTGTALGLCGAFAAPAGAETLNLTVTLPRLHVAEYHKPYVAVWLEGPGGMRRTLSVWYDHDRRGNEGAKWLHEIRQWWRVADRSTTLPADGVSGATRAPGPQRLTLPVGPLASGAYSLTVEAAREAGGRELVRLPFTWTAAGHAAANASGRSELGAISLTVQR